MSQSTAGELSDITEGRKRRPPFYVEVMIRLIREKPLGLIGLIIVLIFMFMAIATPLIASGDPNALGQRAGPSARAVVGAPIRHRQPRAGRSHPRHPRSPRLGDDWLPGCRAFGGHLRRHGRPQRLLRRLDRPHLPASDRRVHRHPGPRAPCGNRGDVCRLGDTRVTRTGAV